MLDVTQYPVSLVIGVMLVLSIGYAVGGVLLGRRLLHPQVREGHNDVVAPIFASLAVLYAVVLGFLVILVWQQYDTAHTNSNEEASTLAAMYRITASMPADEQASLRTDLRAYAEAVIHKEWDAQANGEAAPGVDKALNSLYTAEGAVKEPAASSPANQEFVRSMTTLSVDRNKRILASGERLDPLLWVSLFAGELLTIGLMFLLYSERRLVHILASASFAAFIGLLLGTLLVLDNPFSGQRGISTEAFDHAVSVFDEVDHGAQ